MESVEWPPDSLSDMEDWSAMGQLACQLQFVGADGPTLYIWKIALGVTKLLTSVLLPDLHPVQVIRFLCCNWLQLAATACGIARGCWHLSKL